MVRVLTVLTVVLVVVVLEVMVVRRVMVEVVGRVVEMGGGVGA